MYGIKSTAGLSGVGSLVLLITLFMGGACAGNPSEKTTDKRSVPLVHSGADIEKYNGRRALIFGEFRKKNAGKTWVSYIRLKDGTGVIYRYSVRRSEAERFLGKTVRVHGTVYKGPPPSKYPQQRLLAPHIVNVDGIVLH